MRLYMALLLALCLCGAMVSCADETAKTDGADSIDSGITADSASDITEAAAVSAENSTETADKMEETLKLKHTLRFGDDGKFRILVFSDVHAYNILTPDTKRAIEAVTKKESPDLVLFNGDLNTCPTDADAVKKNITDMTEYLEANSIPWAHVYGNHDSERSGSNPPVSRELQEEMYEAFSWCVSKRGDESVPGVGNYVLPILASDSDKIAFNVWALDSGSYYDDIRPGLYAEAVGDMGRHIYNDYTYAFIRFEQIQWYYNLSKELETYNGAKIPAMMFFHMPICEYYTVANNPGQTGLVGSKKEAICSSEINSGLFTAALDRGDVKLFVAGHDHVNDFVGEYCGIKLSYDASIGFQSYHDESMMGGRVIEIDENDAAAFTTRMSYLKDIPNWNQREDAELRVTESIGEPPYDGDILTADGVSEFKKSRRNLLTSHDLTALDGQFSASGLLTAAGAGAAVSIEEGKGVNGSAAYSVLKGSDRSNSEFTLYLPEAVKLGDAKYLRVMADFTGIDFRKACFGLVTSDGKLYNTDLNDSADGYLDFFTLKDGDTVWKTLSHGSDDGCFGSAQSSSVRDFKGWMAFPIADFLGWEGANGEFRSIKGETMPSDAEIAGIYFYFDLLDDGMLKTPFYFDGFGLVDDYSVFN